MTDNYSPAALAERFGPIVIDLRQRHSPVDERWMLFYTSWRGNSTRGFFRSELFNHYLPAARRSVEKFVKRGAQMVLPSSEFFEVHPVGESMEGADERAQAVQAYLTHVWSKRIKAYGFVRKLFRHFAVYGRCIVKTGVEVVNFTYRDSRTKKDVGGQQVWPTVRIVDPFMLYIYPETQSDIDLCTVIVEDHMMPYDQYKQAVANEAMGVKPIASDDLFTPEWPQYSSRRLQQQQMTEPVSLTTGKDAANVPIQSSGNPPDVARFVSLSEVWWREQGQWCMCWLAWNVRPSSVQAEPDRTSAHPVCVRIAKPRPRHPYRMAVDREMPGEQYTTGMMDDLEPLNVLVNDQINLTLEGQATQFCPPAVIDPDLVSRPASLVFRPRAKWFMKPEGVKWLSPEDTTDAGYKGISFTLGLLDQYSGSGGMAEGQPMRNMPRAGFAVSSMMNVALADTKDAAIMIEDQILSPVTSDFYRLTLEYVPENQIFRIPGANGFPSQQLTLDDMDGDYEFKWVGSLQSQDFQVRAQRMVALLNIMAKLGPAIIPQLQSEGKMIDWEYLFRRIWREGLGERGAGTVIRRYTPEELQAVQALLQQQAAAASKPPVKVSLSGQLDPITSKIMSGEPTPVPIETLMAAEAGQQPKAGASAGNSQSGSANPSTGEGIDRLASAGMSQGMSS